MTKELPINESELEDVDEWNDETLDTPSSITLQLTEDMCGERLDKVLARRIPQFSRSRLQQWIADGFVSVDGALGKRNTTVLGDEEVVVSPQAAPEDHAYLPEAIPLDIVYEDDALLVIDKPAGLVVHPAAGNWSGTLLNGLLHYLPGLATVPRAGIVHRLDKDTSGLMVVAKTLEAHTDLVRQLQARTVTRDYVALVWGKPNLSGTISLSIARHPRDRVKMAVSESPFAKPAITRFQRVAVGALDKKSVSVVQCQLETGRTHQIRVHLAHLGFPIVGDAVYGKPHLAKVFHRQALHAKRLGLIHPTHQKEYVWDSALPDDINTLLALAGINDVCT